MSNLTAVILVGGLGTRLRSVVADRPKVMAEVGGRPFLTYLLEQVGTAGVRNVVLCVGYLGEQIRSVFGNVYGSIHLVYSYEDKPFGTAGALGLALPYIKTESVLVMNGDSYCGADLKSFWIWHKSNSANVSLHLVQVPDTERYGQVQTDNGGRIIDFNEKGQNSGAGWINAGLYLIKKQFVELIPPNRAVSLEREIFPDWIGKGLYGYQGQGRFLDIGTPTDYAKAEHFFSR